MKKTSILLLLTYLFCTFEGISQNIWRCNNDPSVTLSPNMFRTLQAAHDAASAGDIIYVEPEYTPFSSNSTVAPYGDLICTKTLKIYGNGYEQSTNTSVQQPFNKNASTIGKIEVVSGNGTSFIGLQILGIEVKAQNINIARCKIFKHPWLDYSVRLNRTNSTSNPNGTVISHCTLLARIDYAGYSTSTSTCPTGNVVYTANQVSNITIKNNIIQGFIVQYTNYSGIPSGTYPCSHIPVNIPNASNFIITNNVISNYISNCQNCTIHSNIITGVSNSGFCLDCPGSSASNNVCVSASCGLGTNNVFVSSANSNTVFVGGGIGYDKEFQLASGSPAIGAGFGGVDAGAFGTNDPYRISGLAPIPQITSYSKNASSGVYTTSTPMTVTISVRGNN